METDQSAALNRLWLFIRSVDWIWHINLKFEIWPITFVTVWGISTRTAEPNYQKTLTGKTTGPCRCLTKPEKYYYIGFGCSKANSDKKEDENKHMSNHDALHFVYVGGVVLPPNLLQIYF